MSKNKKYSHLTDELLSIGIQDGSYREDGTLIRNVATGEVVKVQRISTQDSSLIPTSYIQINNTTIYQADISQLVAEMTSNRHIEGFNDLEEKYNVVVDLLDSYIVYKNHLPELLKECLTTSVAFENRIRRYLQEFNVSRIEECNTEQFIGALEAYIKVLFVYIVSSYLEYKEKFSSDKTIIAKIVSLDTMLKDVYEQLLVSSRFENEKHTMVMSESLYAHYYFDNDYDLYMLESLVEHDRRFNSVLNVVDFFKKHYSSKGHESRSYGFNQNENYEYTISLSFNKIYANSNKNQLVIKLINIFNEIERLKNIREELFEIKAEEEIFEIVKSSIKSS